MGEVLEKVFSTFEVEAPARTRRSFRTNEESTEGLSICWVINVKSIISEDLLTVCFLVLIGREQYGLPIQTRSKPSTDLPFNTILLTLMTQQIERQATPSKFPLHTGTPKGYGIKDTCMEQLLRAEGTCLALLAPHPLRGVDSLAFGVLCPRGYLFNISPIIVSLWDTLPMVAIIGDDFREVVCMLNKYPLGNTKNTKCQRDVDTRLK
jgi:hypothetical protein